MKPAWHSFESGAYLFQDRDKKVALDNYIKLRTPEAEKRGLVEKLKQAKTLTQARKIMRGEPLK